MITLRTVPLFGSGIAGKSYVVTRQRRLNCYYEQRQDGDKSKVVIYGTPGLIPAFQVSNMPVRGLLGNQTSLFAVSLSTFQEMTPTGTVLGTGTLTPRNTTVAMATNGTQVVGADGVSGFLYDTSTKVFKLQKASFPQNAQTVTNVSGFFVAEQPGSQKFWVSNFNDGSTWNSLAFASASAYADNILAVDNNLGNLIVFSQQHFEQWQNSGLIPQPFSPILSATSEYGLAAIYSRAHVAESIIFLGQNREGQVQFVQVKGFATRVVSNPDLDYIVNQFGTVSDAIAFSYGTDQHKFYQVTFPSANRSFLYDLASDVWSDVQTGPSVLPVRHYANYAAYTGGRTVVSDYFSNQIYTFSPTAYTDAGQEIVREIVTRHVSTQFNRFRPSTLYLDMETGVGLQNGQGFDPQVMLQYSKDNGRTWSAERWSSLGEVGEYQTRVWWRRFGSTRDATFRIRVTDPVKFVITKGAMKVRQKRAA